VEAARLVCEAGFTWEDLRRMGALAARASFLDEPARLRACAALQAWQPQAAGPSPGPGQA
jgi:hypothetical protein